MIREKITIQNKLGLHTRAAAKLVATASLYESQIELIFRDQTANCKSIMNIIMLGVTRGMQLELIIVGADELDARDAIVNLINNRFGEKD